MAKKQKKSTDSILDRDPVLQLAKFARERWIVQGKKERDEPRPWTADPVLQRYRFCCLFREDDRVTKWIHFNWLMRHAKDPDAWFAMCVARLLNQPDALEDVGYPVPWHVPNFLSMLKRRRERGEKIFNAAYIVSTNGIQVNKVVYLAHDVLTPMWKRRESLRPKHGDTLNSYHVLLGQMNGFGSFMTAQVIADLKWIEPLNYASDWHTFAASGPGSRRGLNFVLGRDRKSPWTEEEWRLELGRLREKLLPILGRWQIPTLDAQNVQNLLCEYSKWHRATTEGKMPKQRYDGEGE